MLSRGHARQHNLEKCCYGLLTAHWFCIPTRAILLGAAPDHLSLICKLRLKLCASRHSDEAEITFNNINTQDCSWY